MPMLTSFGVERSFLKKTALICPYSKEIKSGHMIRWAVRQLTLVFPQGKNREGKGVFRFVLKEKTYRE